MEFHRSHLEQGGGGVRCSSILEATSSSFAFDFLEQVLGLAQAVVAALLAQPDCLGGCLFRLIELLVLKVRLRQSMVRVGGTHMLRPEP
eukprot:3360155-Rhodomonas_salina.5